MTGEGTSKAPQGDAVSPREPSGKAETIREQVNRSYGAKGFKSEN